MIPYSKSLPFNSPLRNLNSLITSISSLYPLSLSLLLSLSFLTLSSHKSHSFSLSSQTPNMSIIPQISLSCLLSVVFLAIPIHGIESSRKLDEAGLPGSTDPSIKCGGCSPCGSATCYSSPPPPPPIYYSSPPPPPPKKPLSPPKTGYYCPPPSSSPGFIYMGAPPGSLYPVDQTYNSGSTPIFTSSIFGFGLMGFFLLWL